VSLLPASFSYRRVDTGEVEINVAVAGAGPPVLLLHGYPQTHLIWRRVAPALAREHTVVLADLRGYGDSGKPAPDSDAVYAKRAMARDQLLVMRALGFDRFAVAGHDRGARVAHRLALDAPDAVRALAVLDIVPTRHAVRHTDAHFAKGYFHWFFLAAGGGVPERLIGNDPEFWVRAGTGSRHLGAIPGADGDGDGAAAFREYVRCFSDPATIAASCADYRAALSVDLEHDDADFAAGRRVSAPVLALWGAASFVGTGYDVLEVWRRYAERVHGQALAGGHFLPEETPDAVVEQLVGLLRGAPR
jgi:haloacetate dehalogenase